MRLAATSAVLVAVLSGCSDPPSAPKALLVITKESATFEVELGFPVTPVEILVYNGGAGSPGALSTSISYGAGEPIGWLHAELGSTNAPTVVMIAPIANYMQPGRYGATVTINGSGVDSRSISVVANVTKMIGPVQLYPDSAFYPYHALMGQRLRLEWGKVVSVNILVKKWEFAFDDAGRVRHPRIRAAIYNSERELLGETRLHGVREGRMELPLLQPLSVDPGDYWIMLHSDGQVWLGANRGVSPVNTRFEFLYLGAGLQPPLPTTLPDNPYSRNYPMNVFVEMGAP